MDTSRPSRAVRGAGRRAALAPAVGAVAIMALIASGVSVPDARAESSWSPTPVADEYRVPGKDVAERTLPVSTPRGTTPGKPRWPSGKGRARAAAVSSERGTPVKSTPVRIAAEDAPATGEDWGVEVLDRSVSDAAGVPGVLISVEPPEDARDSTVDVTLDYEDLRRAVGADWASRLRLVELDPCRIETPKSKDCNDFQPLESSNDREAATVSAAIEVDGPTLVAAVAGDSGSTGTYAASSLAPSGSWSAGGNSGGFSWSLPIETPSSPGGVTPQVGLGYSSASVDGRQPSTNNQASWVGEGWDFAPGSVERQYQSCSEDLSGSNTTTKTADLCWYGENAVLSLNGASHVLVKTASGWRLKDHDGSKVELLTGAPNGDNNGEYWRLTSPDGTQYYFGRHRLKNWTSGKSQTNSTWTVPVAGNQAGEPCHGSSFASSFCNQAWRWNLDHVVDAHGNTMTYYYVKEYNYYGKNLSPSPVRYVRGGYLARIEYGQRDGSEYSQPAPARVVFGTSERCVTTSTFTCSTANFTVANASHWPDTPVDLNCTSSEQCTGRYSPTFWTRKRLATVRTQHLAADGSTYSNVDLWALSHSFPWPTDGTTPALFLNSVKRTGYTGGTSSMPAITFDAVELPNRVDSTSDGMPPMRKLRVNTIFGETGSVIGVDYDGAECSPTNLPASDSSNTMRCYPVWWTPENATEPIKEYFHKYTVREVREQDRTGSQPAKVTSYAYLGGVGWAYGDSPFVKPERRTWNEYRGYGTVRTTYGRSPDVVGMEESTYFRGMHGDKLPSGTRSATVKDSDGASVTDHPEFQGKVREVKVYDKAGGSMLSSTLSRPWRGASQGSQSRPNGAAALTSRPVGVDLMESKTKLANGSWRRTKVGHTLDGNGKIVRVDDLGDTGVTGDEMCTRHEFSTAGAIQTLPRRTTVYRKPCSATPALPADLVSDTKFQYDGQAYDKAPTHGDLTQTSQVTSFSGSTPVWSAMSKAGYDTVGRQVSAVDAMDRETTTSYAQTPAGHGLVTKVTTTNAAGQSSTSTVDARGSETSAVDVSGARTDVTYDPLGRMTAVWLPGRDKATETPNTEYRYTIKQTAPSVIETRTLNNAGSYWSSFDILDGLGRTIQTQKPGASSGRVLTDTHYNSRGLPWKVNASYAAAGGASGTLFEPLDGNIPAQTRTTYDGMGRPTVAAVHNRGTEKYRTVTSYAGEVTRVDPPDGAPATASVTDAQGRLTRLVTYPGGSPSGESTETTYTYDVQGNLTKVVDDAGATWSYAYDLMGNRVRSSDPDAGQTDSTYDLVGNLTTAKDARGEVLWSGYDTLDRLVETRDDSASGALRTSYTYDTVTAGLLTSSSRWQEGAEYKTEVRSYDVAGRPKSIRHTIPTAEGALAGTYDFATSYTLNGDVARQAYNSKGGLPFEYVDFGYDGLDYPVSARSNTGAVYQPEAAYTAFGELARGVLGPPAAKVYASFTYDETTRRLTRYRYEKNVAPNVIDTRDYGYDAAGNVTSSVSARSGVTERECFDYDGHRRLTEVWTTAQSTCSTPSVGSGGTVGGPQAYWRTYGYDDRGNRRTEVRHDSAGTASNDIGRTYGYPASATAQPHTLQRVEQSGPGARTDTYAYDEAGHQTNRVTASGSYTQTWDAEGRLASSAKSGGATETYLYDASGSRILKRSGSTAHLYLGGTEYVATGDTVTATRAIPVAGGTVFRSSGDELRYVLADHQGTGQWIVDGDATTATRRTLTPFGEERGASVEFPQDSGFVGGTVDATGLTHIGAREYDPGTGRFVSVDPVLDVTDPQQMNGYAYSHNNPVTFSDPTGLLDDAGNGGAGGHTVWVDGKPYAVSGQKWSDEDAVKGDGSGPGGKKLKTKGTSAGKASGAGPSERDIQKAKEVKRRSILDVIKQEGAEILLEVLGVNDMLNCFTKGDLGACAMMVVGALPWGKILKAKKIGEAVWRAGKAFLRHLDDVKWADEVLACSINSFTPETGVLMADGSSRPIGDLRPGDEVWAADPETGEAGPRAVEAVIEGFGDKDMVDITVHVAGEGVGGAVGSDTVSATRNHPIWSVERGAWVPAGKVVVGDLLRTAAGTFVQVDAVRAYTVHGVGVRNLTVAELHTFFVVVGGASVLTHNCGEASKGAEAIGDMVTMRHYTSTSAARAIIEDGMLRARDQGKVFMTRAKGRPLSPADAEKTLGISKGRGNAVIEFQVPRSRVYERLNPTMGIKEWVADGDLPLDNVKRVR
ncbi:hypothetical protein JQN72_00870 [Phycicoccus sp. CSK15P-2]|uniref:RHS repeat-associated core domain-containing protein n=1 Tax=Phycicoccus sp. CSK15P-2 TaxID=2807627 RepID=UPI00194F66F1|nr:RHS repeat-associated core domain-containing protein [Phycicoccus sp. CSK15P-2]MBM6402797.1 hypothetical protein [Phycicoccus sp. CSK15P-2]